MAKMIQLLCDDCASKKDKSSMTKQFNWDKCFSCLKPSPDRYYNCHDATTNKAETPSSLIGHACCARCLYGWNALKNGSTTTCPLCRGSIKGLIEAKVCTLVEIPDNDTASRKANLASLPKETAVDLPKKDVVDRYVVKDVRGVRLGRKDSERKVRVRWEDTWERSDLADTRFQVKRVVKQSPGFNKIRWKDTWEPLEYLDNGILREKAIRLLEEKFGL